MNRHSKCKSKRFLHQKIHIRKQQFINDIGKAYEDIGFVALKKVIF